ncbi:MAG: ABC transporter permease [Demequina sp.]|nr:ABC transporter permease [Demequina sp.]
MTRGSSSAGEPTSAYAELAAKHGLVQQGVRGPFGAYLRDIWRSRNFIWELARTRTYSANENTYLGQLWAILNPLFFAGVYYLVFGVVLDTRGNVDNFVGFLVIGVFVFQFLSAALSSGASAIVSNTSMIRSLRFPRAALPISVVLTEFLTLLPAIVVMFVLVSFKERPSWEWLMAVPMFFIITIFNVGVALFMSRLTNHSRDLKNITPLISRVLRYMSGVFYPISYYTNESIGALILQYQPYALALDVIRAPLLSEFPIMWGHVLAMTGWAVIALVVGIVYFWRGEGKYGVD